MKIETENFKKQLADALSELGFTKQSNRFYYENDEILFVVTPDKSDHSNLYYIRGGFFVKPLDKEIEKYKYYESLHRWYAKFPIFKNYILFKKFIKNTDSVDLESINQEGLSVCLKSLKEQLNSLLPSLTKEMVKNYTLRGNAS